MAYRGGGNLVRPASHEREGDGVVRHSLSALDLVAPRRCIQVSPIFKLETRGSEHRILDTLLDGLSKALAEYRPLAGRLRLDETDTPWIAISKADSVQFTVSRIENDFPSFTDLEKVSFAQELMDPSADLPPGKWENTAAWPVKDDSEGVIISAYRASFIRGGMILNMSCHHMCCDATGIYNFMYCWAIRCQLRCAGEEIELPAASSHSLPSSLDGGDRKCAGVQQQDELMSRLHRYKYTHRDRSPFLAAEWLTPITRNVIFHFPTSKLEALRKKLTPRIESVSRKDSHAITTLLFQAVTRARMKTFHARPNAVSDISFGFGLRWTDSASIDCSGLFRERNLSHGNREDIHSGNPIRQRPLTVGGSPQNRNGRGGYG
jgi:Transferase family